MNHRSCLALQLLSNYSDNLAAEAEPCLPVFKYLAKRFNLFFPMFSKNDPDMVAFLFVLFFFSGLARADEKCQP